MKFNRNPGHKPQLKWCHTLDKSVKIKVNTKQDRTLHIINEVFHNKNQTDTYCQQKVEYERNRQKATCFLFPSCYLLQPIREERLRK